MVHLRLPHSHHWHLKHLSHHDTKSCIPASKKSVWSVCSQEVTACFTSASCCKSLPSRMLLREYSPWRGYGMGDPGLDSQQRQRIYLFSKTSRPAPGPNKPPTHWVPGTLSPALKRPLRAVDRSPQANAEVTRVNVPLVLYIASTTGKISSN
jgi:hypothetical protein